MAGGQETPLFLMQPHQAQPPLPAASPTSSSTEQAAPLAATPPDGLAGTCTFPKPVQSPSKRKGGMVLRLELVQLPRPKQGTSSGEMEGRLPVTSSTFG